LASPVGGWQGGATAAAGPPCLGTGQRLPGAAALGICVHGCAGSLPCNVLPGFCQHQPKPRQHSSAIGTLETCRTRRTRRTRRRLSRWWLWSQPQLWLQRGGGVVALSRLCPPCAAGSGMQLMQLPPCAHPQCVGNALHRSDAAPPCGCNQAVRCAHVRRSPCGASAVARVALWALTRPTPTCAAPGAGGWPAGDVHQPQLLC
jgi:hypothetical protein